MKHGILLHEPQDDVGVAVTDLKKGTTIGAVTLEGKAAGKVKLLQNVPLGHKVALRDLPKDRQVIKYGRLQFGEDLELTFRTLSGIGCNANIAAAVVIGIEPKWTERIVKEIRKTGKPVAGFSIERSGDLKTIEAASRKAKEFVQYATELQRQPFP